MKLQAGEYDLYFENGGVEIRKGGNVLYFNRRSMYAFVKTTMAVTPTSRLLNTFGAYDIACCEKISAEEKAKRNRIYDEYAAF